MDVKEGIRLAGSNCNFMVIIESRLNATGLNPARRTDVHIVKPYQGSTIIQSCRHHLEQVPPQLHHHFP